MGSIISLKCPPLICLPDLSCFVLAAIRNGASLMPGLILLMDSTIAVVSSAGLSNPWPRPPFVEVTTGS